MTLETYLKRKRVQPVECASALGVRPMSVTRYLNGRIPEPPVMRRIIAWTAGAVTPNDFYGLKRGARRPS